MYYKLLPEIKNALRAGKDKMTVPFSRMDLAVLTVLLEPGGDHDGSRDALLHRFGNEAGNGIGRGGEHYQFHFVG